MPVPVEDTWSDSDDDELAEVETSVLLGVPDGPMSAESDLADAAVSRIGGHPVRDRLYQCIIVLYVFIQSKNFFMCSHSRRF
jgi:hypothetical protein